MEPLSNNETFVGLKRFMINPFSIIENIFKKRNSKKRKKELQLKMAIFSGGIKRMK